MIILDEAVTVEKVEVKWTPAYNGKYYFLSDELDVISARFNPDNSVNRNRIEIGNCFKTREEAEKKRKEVLEKAIKELRGK